MSSSIPPSKQGVKPQKREVKKASKQCEKEFGLCPEDVRDAMLFQLHERVAMGKSPMLSVDPKKVRDDVMQMSFPYKGDTYRALYSTKHGKIVLLLVTFQKKKDGSVKDQYDLAVKRLNRYSDDVS